MMQRWHVGDATVTAIVEAETGRIPPAMFFPAATASDVAAESWLVPDFADAEGALIFRVQAFVIDDGLGRRVVVDPCVGNDKQRALPFWHLQRYTFLDDLTAAGFDPLGVDLVVHTHLHADHVGWDTRLVGGSWVPTFPNAHHLYTQRELDHRLASDQAGSEDVYGDSIAPIFEAGLAGIVAEDEDLGDGLRLAPTPGHTPGHTSLWIESAGERAVISGDLIHHPVQCARPGWAEVADADAELARRTRHSFLSDVALERVVMFGTHFPTNPAGRVVPYEDTWRFAPVPAHTD
jgi:glyoxylase-like metal-dependent hydrolase (beta-lactamase superfamily II)